MKKGLLFILLGTVFLGGCGGVSNEAISIPATNSVSVAESKNMNVEPPVTIKEGESYKIEGGNDANVEIYDHKIKD